jgi:flagellin
MALTINTNVSSLVAQRNLNNATNALNTAIEKLTTGYTINHAADNAAGYSISKIWVTQLGSLDIAADNASTGADMLTTAEENYGLLTSHLQRIRDLTEQAANGTYGSASLKAIHAEIVARLQEINRISANAEFNGITLMDGQGVGANGLNLQVGLYANANSRITLAQALFSDASLKGLFTSMAETASEGGKKLSELLTGAKSGATVDDLVTDANKSIEAFAAICSGLKYNGDNLVQQKTENYEPIQMLKFLDAAIDNISNRVTQIGAAQNRITSALSSLDVQSQNITSSLSTLRDTDVAKESSNYLQAQILQQASATLLATANQLPSVALNLL